MKKFWKIFGIVIAVIVGLFLLGYLLLLWAFAPGDTKELEELANRFKPNPSWEVENKTVYPKMRACLDANCDSLYYTWSTKESLTRNDLEAVLAESNFDFVVEGDCDPSKGLNGVGSSVCRGAGQVDGYTVAVNVIGAADKPVKKTISLNIYK